MTQTGTGSKADEAAKLREYARQQGELARALKSGKVQPIFYKVRTLRNNREVREHCHVDHLTEAERQRQINEAVRHAVLARAEANRKAKELG